MLIHQYHNNNHILRDMPLRVKSLYTVPAFLLMLISNSLLFNTTVLLVYFTLGIVLAKLHFLRLLRLYSIPLFFIGLGCVTLIVSINGDNSFIKYKNFSVGFDINGINQSKVILSKSLGIFSVVIFSLFTFTISEISDFMRALRIPKTFVELFVLTYKFILCFWSSSRCMLVAQKCRLAYTVPGKRIYHFSMLIYSVFRNAIIQAQQLEIAMESRNSTGEFTFIRMHKTLKTKPLLISIGFAAILISLYILLQ